MESNFEKGGSFDSKLSKVIARFIGLEESPRIRSRWNLFGLKLWRKFIQKVLIEEGFGEKRFVRRAHKNHRKTYQQFFKILLI